MPYLTGDGADGDCQLSLSFANDPFLRRAITGQLTELLHPHIWEQFGSLSVDDTLALVQDALSTLSLICNPEVSTMFVMVTRSTNFAMSPHTDTKITGLSAVYDTGQWDNDNQRVVLDEDGLYIVVPQWTMQAVSNATTAYLVVNSATVTQAHKAASASVVPLMTQPMLWPLEAGDLIEVWARIFNFAQITTLNGIIGYMVARVGGLS